MPGIPVSPSDTQLGLRLGNWESDRPRLGPISIEGEQDNNKGVIGRHYSILLGSDPSGRSFLQELAPPLGRVGLKGWRGPEPLEWIAIAASNLANDPSTNLAAR